MSADAATLTFISLKFNLDHFYWGVGCELLLASEVGHAAGPDGLVLVLISPGVCHVVITTAGRAVTFYFEHLTLFYLKFDRLKVITRLARCCQVRDESFFIHDSS